MIKNEYYITEDANSVFCRITGKRSGKPTSIRFSKIDDEIVRQHKWNTDSLGYAICICHQHLAHRLILNAPASSVVDHINRDVRDNRRSNLRITSQKENMWNRGVSKNRKFDVPVKGVYWNGYSWATEIVKGGTVFRKAGFDNLHEAICHRIRKEYELYGEYSANYRKLLPKLPKNLIKIYFPEIYGKDNIKFIGTPIYKAHYKNKQIKDSRHFTGVRKAGTTM